MDFHEISRGFEQMWENRPGAVVLLALGFMVFVFIVVDAWRQKRRRKRPLPRHWRP